MRLLVLSADDGEKLNREYADQQEIIRRNILEKYGLDSKGRDLGSSVADYVTAKSSRQDIEPLGQAERASKGGTSSKRAQSRDKDEENEDWARIRQALRETVKKRTLDNVLALLHAADRGDADEVRRLLHSHGVDVNWCDYDGKTLVHICAAQGKYRMVEILLEEGANKNAVDRWNRAPLQVRTHYGLLVHSGVCGPSCTCPLYYRACERASKRACVRACLSVCMCAGFN